MAQWLQALALILLCSIALLWKPLTTGDYYAPADITQRSPLLHTTAPGHVPSNPVLSDVASQILPWQLWDAAQIRQGHLPLWNPYDGSGAPLLANSQSAPFSIFNTPFVLLSVREALVLSVALVLLVAGLGSYGLARHLGSGHLGGLVALIGFTFAGVNLAWLHWTVAAAASLLPLAAWMGCLVVDARSPRRRLLACVALAVAVGVGFLSGHPETSFYAVAGVVVVCGFRLLADFRSHHDLARSARYAGLVVGSLVAGAMLAAVGILPTLQYLSNGASSGQRQSFAAVRYASITAFPFFNGSPFSSNRSLVLSIGLSYVNTVLLYLAAALFVLALVGWSGLFRRRRSTGIAIAGLGLVWLAVIFDIGGFGDLITKLPVLHLAIALRSVPLYALAVSLLAARGTTDLRRAVERGGAGRHRALLDLGIATAVVVVAGLALYLQARANLPHSGPSVVTDVATTSRQHVAFVTGWFLVAVVAVGAPIWLRGRPALTGRADHAIRIGSAVLLLVALFASSGFLWRSWNPTVPASEFYPRSSSLDGVQAVVGSAQTLRLDDTEIPPDINLQYRAVSPENYDAIEVGRYDALYRRLLHTPPLILDGAQIGILSGPATPSGIGNLRMLGIRYVTTKTPYPFADHRTIVEVPQAGGSTTRAAIPHTFLGAQVVNQIAVTATAMTPRLTCTVSVAQVGGPIVATWRGACGSGGVAAPLPRSVAVGRGLVASVSTRDGSAATTSIASSAQLVAIDTKVPGLRLAADVEGALVYAVPGTPGLVFSPASTVSRDPGHAVVDDPQAQPAQLSFVDASDGASTGTAPGAVKLISNQPGDIRFRVTRATPGWVIVQQTSYPGWTATVNGRSTGVAPGNDAFLAVRVPAGTSTVRVAYQPSSVRIGLAVSLLTAIALMALLVLAWRDPWARRRSAAVAG